MNKKTYLKTEYAKKLGYQIFPASFFDSNNDGIGDLKGIAKKIKHLKELQVDYLWLNPIYETDFKDAGYDVNNYYGIYDKFGTYKDAIKLIDICKQHNIDIVFDIVLNHSSDKHIWFLDCLEKGPSSKYWDFYVWYDKPNDAESIFGGSAWTYIKKWKKYYFHLFDKSQPDFNWGSKNLRQEIYKMINHWIKEGVKGFRIDAIEHVGKDIDNKVFRYGPNMHKYLKELYDTCFYKKDIFTIGESWNVKAEDLDKLCNSEQKVVDTYFNFSWLGIGWSSKGRSAIAKYDKESFINNILNWQKDNINPNLFANFLTNHDSSRAFSRWGSEKYYDYSCKLLSTLLFSLRGMVFLYYGEEVGMKNPEFTKVSEFRDVDFFNNYKLAKTKKQKQQMIKGFSFNGRDASRTPMQWDDSLFAGFSKNEPWIKNSMEYIKYNLKTQQKDKNSIYNYTKQLIDIRKLSNLSNCLTYGNFKVLTNQKGVIVFSRQLDNKKLTILLNMNDTSKKYEFDPSLKVVINNYDNIKQNTLMPWQSIILEE